ncbi:methylenetetrahydrofolate reductase [NAD(P)H] [Lacibacterium aquatile]|uniref:Methylenetetrahydrofolate reductase n=1 Tax=Lacibacterium aquatile TaxID=1168082 RepID=A0ABW5DUX8_9PROT
MTTPTPASNPVPKISFEFFPPKTEEMEATLWTTVQKLAPLNPSFVSVTYGAGGTTRERTHSTVRRIRQETALAPAAHLTCVGANKAEIAEVAQDYWDAGIRHIVALRGDPPAGAEKYQPHPGGYASSTDLVRGLRDIGDFEISVGCYPEGHPEATSLDADLDYLKRKIDAGATRAISQYFFDTDVFARFIERARKAGIEVPIVPGILPVTNFAQVVKFSGACGTSVPGWLAETFEGLDSDPETRKLVAASVAVEQVQKLRAYGIDDFHFYTLNRAELTLAICRRLGIRPAPAHAAA